jgi:hypothetical protein
MYETRFGGQGKLQKKEHVTHGKKKRSYRNPSVYELNSFLKKLLARRKLVKRKLISHYFPRRGAGNNDLFARGKSSNRKLAHKLENSY